jgi:capsular exopolysaccharide synthesis family protein
VTGTTPIERYVDPVRRWWPVVVGAVVLGVVVAWITMPSAPDPSVAAEGIVDTDPNVSYTASQILVPDRVTPATSNLTLVATLARQPEVHEAVRDVLGEQVDAAAVDGVMIEADDKLGTLTLTAEQPTEEQVVLLLETYATTLTEYFDERSAIASRNELERTRERLAAIDVRIRELESELGSTGLGELDRRLAEAELDVLIDQYGFLQGQARDLGIEDVGVGSTFVTLQEPAPVSTAGEAGGAAMFEAAADRSLVRLPLAALLAGALGLALTFGIDRLDTRVRTRQGAEAAFGLPTVAEIPWRNRRDRERDPLPVHSKPGSDVAEAFRALRLAVQLSPRWQLRHDVPTSESTVGSATPVAGRGAPRTLLVTSGITGEGKSTVAANLAASIAESGQRVVLLDCDFRRSTASRVFGLADGPGLRDLLELREETLGSLVRPTSVPGVSIVPAGTPGVTPAWFLAGAATLVELASRHADVVVIDTGPVLVTNEAAALVPVVDAVLLVSRIGRTSGEQARDTVEKLTRLNALVAGIALVGGEATKTYGYFEPIRKDAAGTGVDTA